MTDSVSIGAVEAAASANNRPGPDHMNCGESVIAALWDAFEPDFPRSVVAMGAGMGAGVGGSGCICGALAGAVAFLGLMVGTKERAKPAAAKGQYIRSCVTASTMGPGVKINANRQA